MSLGLTVLMVESFPPCLSHFSLCSLSVILPCTAVKSLPSASSWLLCGYREAAIKPPLLQATQVQFPQRPLAEQELQPLTTSARSAQVYHCLSRVEAAQNQAQPIAAVNWHIVLLPSCISWYWQLMHRLIHIRWTLYFYVKGTALHRGIFVT